MRLRNRVSTLIVTGAMYALASTAHTASMQRRLPSPAAATTAPVAAAPAATLPVPAAAPTGMLAAAAPCAAPNDTPRIANVDGYRSQVAFAPGGRYRIAGCGFGATPGSVFLVSSYGLAWDYEGDAERRIALSVESWQDDLIVASVPADFGGLPDLGYVNVTVQGAGQSPLSLEPNNRFVALRESVSIPIPAGVRPEFAGFLGNPKVSQTGDRTVVERFQGISDGFCPSWDEALVRDLWHVENLRLRTGFTLDDIVAENGTEQEQHDYRDSQTVVMGQFNHAFVRGQNYAWVVYQGHSMYAKKILIGVQDTGYSLCNSRYTIRLVLSGPRGVAPLRAAQK